MAEISDAEKLARAVLLFHAHIPWDREATQLWAEYVGDGEAASKTLCDLARRVRDQEESKRPDVDRRVAALIKAVGYSEVDAALILGALLAGGWDVVRS